MDLERLVVTMLGLGLIVAVNLYFFARPQGGRRERRTRPGRGGEPGQGPARQASPGRDKNLLRSR
jgi:hypothetical protein